MSIIERLANLFRAEANAVLDQVEDPQKITELAISELADFEKQAQRRLLEMMTFVKLAEKHAVERALEITRMGDAEPEKKAAQMALLADEKNRVWELRGHVAELKAGLADLKRQIALVKSQPLKRATFEDTAAFETYNRMAAKVETMEAEVEALKEMQR